MLPSNNPTVLRAYSRYRSRLKAARNDFAAFGPLVAQDDRGAPIEYVPMHMAWVHHLSYCWAHGLHCCILAHFGSGKSSGFAVPLLSWLVGRDPQIRIKYISHSDELARRAISGVKQIMEAPTYKSIFPNVRPGAKWAEQEAFVERSGGALDPTLHAKGVDSKGVGGRADVLVFDDVCDEKNSESEAVRAKIKNRVHRTWMSRLADPVLGRVLWIATIWNVDDATSELQTLPGWCTLIQRVAADCGSIEQEVVGADPDSYRSHGSFYRRDPDTGLWSLG